MVQGDLVIAGGNLTVNDSIPTTILTFGFLMLTNNKLSKYLLIIPTIWAIIGTGAAINFDVYQDYFMILSAIIADFYLIKRKKQASLTKSYACPEGLGQ